MKMWYCIDCDEEFEFYIPDFIWNSFRKTCPFCGSKEIVDCLEMDAAIKDLVSDSIDNEMKKTVEELNAAIKDLVPEMPEHPKCLCANKYNNSDHLTNLSKNVYGYIVEGVTQLSFDDLEINEKLLIGLPLEDASNNYNAQVTCITEMNERFLHTFIDDCYYRT